jgi:hypothetical protein
MKRTLLTSIVAMSIAGGTVVWAQAPFSCGQVRLQGEMLDPELRAWIVLTARRPARDFERRLWEKYPDLPCIDLSCRSDEEIVVDVRKACALSPAQTLENAIQAARLAPLFDWLKSKYPSARAKPT